MGLAGRKQKQRIPNDPRNLSWADDANKFGAAYLQKLGWSAGSGLGASGEGRTTHIKVHQKLDMFGIGAAHQKDPNGIAWKQNKDFENLLKRLNATEEEADVEDSRIDGFARATESRVEDAVEDLSTAEGETGADKKRKREKDRDDGRKRSKKSKDGTESKDERRKEKKKAKKQAVDTPGGEAEDTVTMPSAASQHAERSSSSATSQSTPVIPRPFRAHRARFLASKRLASKPSSAIDEILGISRSASASAAATPYLDMSGHSTPLDTSSTSPSDESDLKLQELTTSSKSVMDYFKEKLLAKSNAASFASTPIASTPRSEEDDNDYDDRPRGGLGLGLARTGLGVGGSTLRSELTFTETEVDARTGIGMFSGMSAMFTSTTTSGTEGTVETIGDKELIEVEAQVERRIRKEEKRQKGRERRKEEEQEKEVDAEAPEDPEEAEVGREKKSRKSKRRKGIVELIEPCAIEAEAAAEIPQKKDKTKKSQRKMDVDIAIEPVADKLKAKKKKIRSVARGDETAA